MPAVISLLSLGLASVVQPGPAAQREYAFHGEISQVVLENYLSRSLEYLGLCSEGSSGPAPCLDDTLAMIQDIEPKFIGRAAYAWDCPVDDEVHYRLAAENAARVHAIDPEIILQACVFETAYSNRAPEAEERLERDFSPGGVEDIPIPAWVFEEYGMEPEDRSFRYEDMIYADGHMRNMWVPGGSVPDITTREAQLWFFYRAVRYIDAGYEAVHFGQAQIMARDDPEFAVWDDLLGRVRRYASGHARRGYVLCDAHLSVDRRSFGAKVGDRLLWDFIGFPLRPAEGEQPLEGRLEVGYLDSLYGKAPGGIHPSGWACDTVPQLYEFDNCHSGLTDAGSVFIWGADESTWLANLPMEERHEFLEYAYEWIWTHSPHGYLQMPGRRPAFVPVTDPSRWMYICNPATETCPKGFGDAGAMARIWSQPRYQDTTDRPDDVAVPRPPAPAGVSPGLVGRWTFEEAQRHGGMTTIPGEAAEGPELVVRRGRSLEMLRALYLAHGGHQSEADRAEGRRLLEELAEAAPDPFIDAPGGRAYAFDGSSYLEADGPELAAPRMALSVRVRIDDFDESFVLVDRHEWPRAGYYIKFHAPGDELYGEVFDGSEGRKVVQFRGVRAGQWHRLDLVADGEILTARVDGEITDQCLAGSVIPADRPLTIGYACHGIAVAEMEYRALP
ncbi:MAG: hypothetical protein GF320_07910 [Armatimonadia bacterium]|nr:hypothetical protein [Armatimonadia bacterium]